jgi:hypothetical protein
MRIDKNYFFLILVLFTVFLAVMAILIPTPPKSKIGPPSLSPTQPPKKLALLNFQPESLNLTRGQEFTSNVFLRTEKEAVSADLEIIYNPEVLTFQKLALGGFWPEGKLISQKIDKKNGTILVGVVSFKPASGSGNLISLTFKVQKGTEEAPIKLIFGEKTQVFSPGGKILPLEIKREAIYTIIE